MQNRSLRLFFITWWGVAATASMIATATVSANDDIEFVERFALAEDREAILKELVPGSENYYYFHCLHYQNVENFAAVDRMTKAWIAKFGNSRLVRQILNRQALLTYDTNPKKSIEYLTQQLNLDFTHQRESLQGPALPSVLDQDRVSRKTLTARALAQYGNTDGFETRALDWLLDQPLEINDLRHLLQRITTPDHPQLIDMLVRELSDRRSRGFGTMAIHRNLTKSQLVDLRKKLPRLLNQQNYVNIVLSKIRPNPDANYEGNYLIQRQHLNEIWNFVCQLAPAHNSLKANVLYHRLVLDRSEGNFDRDVFTDYIKLPRNMSYVNSDYINLDENKRDLCNFSTNFRPQTLLPPIGNDSAIVSDYLQHFFKSDQDYKSFATYLKSSYLKRQFAEAKIVNGLGSSEKWAALLSPAEYQQIKERVGLSFTHANQFDYLPNDQVAIELNVKNVSKLIVKVFEINTQNYYRDRLTEIDTNIELDGLLPNQETVYEYSETPFIQKQRRFVFPEMDKRGTYIVDFIGNRKSCRALVRKGNLRLLEKVTAAGHELTVINETSEVLKSANVWLQGKLYESDEDGRVFVPFSNRPGWVPVVVSDGKSCSLARFTHQSESYNLDAGIYVDRESLIEGHKANVIIRSRLLINGVVAPLSLLENSRLVLTSTDIDGTVSTKVVKDFALFQNRESSFEFKVPSRLQAIQVQVLADIKNLSRAKIQTLSETKVFYVNKIEQDTKVEDLFFCQTKNGFAIDMFGKNGEPKVGRPVSLKIKHRDFKNVVTATLQTNLSGRITLGPLSGIDSVEAIGPEGTRRIWTIPQNNNSHQSILARVGDSISVAMNKFSGELSRRDVALFETNGATWVSDHFSKIQFANGLLSINGLSAGDYRLFLKNENKSISIFVSDGKNVKDEIIGPYRRSVIFNPTPVQISNIKSGKVNTTISISGASAATRIHLVATRFQPRFDLFRELVGMTWNRSPGQLSQSRSLFVDGRKIGDEYQYILDRKYVEKFPGVMLKRPGLLLQPWAVRSTKTATQKLNEGNKFEDADQSKPGSDKQNAAGQKRPFQNIDESTMEFLANGSTMILNVVPKDGKIVLDNRLLESHSQIHVLAISDSSTAYRFSHVSDQAFEPKDRSFVSGLDPDQRFARKKEITFVDSGSEFVVTDVVTGKFELYDNLPAVFRLLTSLNGNANLEKFRFILEWRNKSEKEKLELYSEFACHELNFFLYKKDRTFFEAVVQPYIRNKKDKTFIDRFLLGESLKSYTQSWDYAQLNVVERVLLANSIADEKNATSRNIRDRYNTRPTPRSAIDQFFRFGVSSTALDADSDGLDSKLGEISRGIKSLDEKKVAAIRQADSAANYAYRENQPPKGQTATGNDRAGGEITFSVDPVDGQRLSGRDSSGKEAFGLNGIVATPELANELRKSRRLGIREKESLLESLKDSNGRSDAKYDMRFELDKKLMDRRKSIEQLFRQVEKTQEFAENNYYNLTIDKQVASLISVNQFWKDFASHDSAEPFYSTNVSEASRNFTEMMFALSVLDLKWEANEHDYQTDDKKLRLTAKSPLLIFHEQIRPAKDGRKETSILVSQNFYQIGDRYRYEGPDRLDKFVTDEFIKQTPYGCQVVITNPTSSKQKIDLLLQIPVGSLPLGGHPETKSVHIELDPYRTSSIEYHFYFPVSGKYKHYPVNVAKNETVIAFAEPANFNVVNQPSKVDKTSWIYISQNGTSDDVLTYIENSNLVQTDFDKIAWRMNDKVFFESAVGMLSGYHVFNPTLWAYAFKHNAVSQMKDYLVFHDDFVSSTGPYIESSLLTNDRIARRTYEHLEYEPLVNARIHQLGANRKILNNRLNAQYHRLLWILACKNELSNNDLMSMTYYMLLQDRIGEAIAYFKKATAGSLQYDYMAAYLDMFNDRPVLARKIASRYANYKVERWRKAFRIIISQLDEIEGRKTEWVDDANRTEIQTKLASQSPTFDFKVDAKKIDLTFENIDRVLVNYYVMDVELLFSRNPFVQQFSGELTYIRPRKTEWVELPKQSKTHQWELPAELGRSNVLVEVSSGDQTKAQAYYAHALSVQTIERFGQLQVNHQSTGRSIPKTYCKVYARMKNGEVKFYKDGYTDLRGRFDYTSLSTNDLDNVQRFSILVMSNEDGTTVKEVMPPKR